MSRGAGGQCQQFEVLAGEITCDTFGIDPSNRLPFYKHLMPLASLMV